MVLKKFYQGSLHNLVVIHVMLKGILFDGLDGGVVQASDNDS